jgi:hypothetical protein
MIGWSGARCPEHGRFGSVGKYEFGPCPWSKFLIKFFFFGCSCMVHNKCASCLRRINLIKKFILPETIAMQAYFEVADPASSSPGVVLPKVGHVPKIADLGQRRGAGRKECRKHGGALIWPLSCRGESAIFGKMTFCCRREYSWRVLPRIWPCQIAQGRKPPLFVAALQENSKRTAP